MAHRRGGLSQRQGRRHLAELVGMRNELLRARAFGHLQDQLPLRKDQELARRLDRLVGTGVALLLQWLLPEDRPEPHSAREEAPADA